MSHSLIINAGGPPRGELETVWLLVSRFIIAPIIVLHDKTSTSLVLLMAFCGLINTFLYPSRMGLYCHHRQRNSVVAWCGFVLSCTYLTIILYLSSSEHDVTMGENTPGHHPARSSPDLSGLTPSHRKAPKQKFSIRRSNSSPMCLAILTGHPALNRKIYLDRLLGQLANDVIHPKRGLEVHVFCEGSCTDLKSSTLRIVPHDLRSQNESGSQSVIGRLGSSMCKDGCDSERQEFFHGAISTQDKKELFRSNRWIYLSENYKRMFDSLFYRDGASEFCTFLEDDLIVSRDSLLCLRAGEMLLQRDPTVFTVSLNNDNSYPLYARNSRRFLRVDHFSGLGFIMSQDHYVTLIRPVWNLNRNWDTIIQKKMSQARMVSIRPEITRSVHIRGKDVHTMENIVPRDVFESQLFNTEVSRSYNLKHMAETSYARFVVEFAEASKNIEHIEDALFSAGSTNFTFWSCSTREDLHRILTERFLIGKGNGDVIRNSYKGTLFLPLLNSRILIICRHSPFFKILQSRKLDNPMFPSGEQKNEALRLFSVLQNSKYAVSRSRLGVVSRLRSDYNLRVAKVGISCNVTCTQSGSRCDRVGLWLLNTDCTVLETVSPEACVACSPHAQIKPHLPYLPAIGTDGQCTLAYPHFLNCFSASPRHRRICPCRK